MSVAAVLDRPATDHIVQVAPAAGVWWARCHHQNTGGTGWYSRHRVAAWGTTATGEVVALVPGDGYALGFPTGAGVDIIADGDFGGCCCDFTARSYQEVDGFCEGCGGEAL